MAPRPAEPAGIIRTGRQRRSIGRRDPDEGTHDDALEDPLVGRRGREGRRSSPRAAPSTAAERRDDPGSEARDRAPRSRAPRSADGRKEERRRAGRRARSGTRASRGRSRPSPRRRRPQPGSPAGCGAGGPSVRPVVVMRHCQPVSRVAEPGQPGRRGGTGSCRIGCRTGTPCGLLGEGFQDARQLRRRGDGAGVGMGKASERMPVEVDRGGHGSRVAAGRRPGQCQASRRHGRAGRFRTRGPSGGRQAVRRLERRIGRTKERQREPRRARTRRRTRTGPTGRRGPTAARRRSRPGRMARPVTAFRIP